MIRSRWVGLALVIACAPNTPTADPRRSVANTSLGEPPKEMDHASAIACDAGDKGACIAAARSYAPKRGYRADLPKAEADARAGGTARYARRACELGAGEGCALVAEFGPHDDVTEMLTRACDLGYVASCGSLGGGAFYQSETQAERQHDADLVEKACRADAVDWRSLTSHHGGFCRQLVGWYADELKNSKKADELQKLQCTQGDQFGCPCKIDTDCGALPDDEGGLGYYCNSGTCNVASSE